MGISALLLLSCGADPKLQPDEVLQSELGLPLPVRVHRIPPTWGDADRAEPGQVLVSNVVMELCEGKTFEFASLGAVSLKGFDEAVPLFEGGRVRRAMPAACGGEAE